MRMAFLLLLAAIVLATIYAWIGLAGAPPVAIRAWPGAATVSLPAWLIPLGGALVIGCGLLALAIADEMLVSDAASELVFPILVVAATVMVWAAVDRGTVEPLRGGLFLTLAILTIASARTTLAMLRNGGAIGVRSHWGGLGNAIGGWQVLPTTVALLLTLAFVSAAFVVATGKSGTGASEQAAPPAKTGAGAPGRGNP